MQPIFKITADRKDITSEVNARLVSLTLTDERGLTSDTLTIVLDDSDKKMAIPRKGVKLNIFLGYKERGMIPRGGFIVDEVKLAGPPSKLTISAKGANLRASLRTKKSRSWDQVTIGAMVKKIAAEHGMIPKVSASLSGIPVDHIDQQDRSDLQLLQELSRDHDALLKCNDEFLLFMPNGESKSASGKPLPVIPIKIEENLKYSCTLPDREIVNSVIASWRDTTTAQTKTETAGSGEPSYTIKNPYPDQQAAQRAAKGKLKSLQRKKGELKINDLPGDPAIFAESPIPVTGIRSGIDGQWVVKKATHKFTKSAGYKTSIDLEPPK